MGPRATIELVHLNDRDGIALRRLIASFVRPPSDATHAWQTTIKNRMKQHSPPDCPTNAYAPFAKLRPLRYECIQTAAAAIGAPDTRNES